MRVIIVGASRFGVATVRQLIEDGHEAVLVDRDRARLDRISDEIDCGLIHGDGTLPSILREARADGADILMMLTSREEANILGAAVGRSIGFEEIVIRINRTEIRPICNELGFQNVVMPHEMAARSIVASLGEGTLKLAP